MSIFNTVRTNDEVQALEGEVMESINSGGSRFPGMSYEEGVEATLRWLQDGTWDHPYPEK